MKTNIILTHQVQLNRHLEQRERPASAWKIVFITGLATCNFGLATVFSQNVGINDDGSIPGAFLHVKYTTSASVQAEVMRIERYVTDITAADEGAYIGMYLKDNDNGGVEVARLGFKSGGDGTAGNEDEGELSFSTSNSAGALQQHMTINSAGNVGIGTTNPSTKLDIDGDIRIRNLNAQGIVVTSESGQLNKLNYGTSSQFLRGDGTWQAPAAPAEISICEFMSSETVYNGGNRVFFVVPASMNGKTMIKAIAKGGTGVGSTTATIRKNGIAISGGAISSVSSSTATQSGTLATTLATGDVISVSSSATSGVLNGLTITISVQ